MGAQSGPPDGIGLRPATPEDLAFLIQLHAATIKEYVDKTWGWDEDLQQARYRETFNPGDTQIITLDGIDIGMLAVEERTEVVFLTLIEIDPAHQNRGIGSVIIQQLIADGIERGKPVGLQVLKVNPAKRLYERLGFSVIGETPVHYLMQTSLTRRETGHE